MSSFAYDSCIACERRWAPADQRKEHEWRKVYDHEVARWCCYRCVNIMWRKSASAADIRELSHSAAEKLQTQAFQDELRWQLELHKRKHATDEPMSMDADDMDVDI